MSGPEAHALTRVVGVPGAVLLGLGSIVGTGVFVSLGLAAGVGGPWIVPATLLAAAVAACNGLSSAQLAAAHPVSGGTYEYGHRLLGAPFGLVAGWTFLAAKSASAATAALGLAGYVLAGAEEAGAPVHALVALAAIAALTAWVAGGMGRSNRANAVVVGVTLAALGAFVVGGLGPAARGAAAHLVAGLDREAFDARAFLHATALLFVAYTGYGRIATLGEEVRDPGRNIPRAIVLTLAASALLYGAVATVAVASVGAGALAAATAEGAAPLAVVARGFGVPGLPALVAVGATTAMLGVLLNLLLGLSRVVLAMARRGDLPTALARVEGHAPSPRRAVLAVGGVVAALVLVGDVKTTWSFSAFTVLVYYAITNLAALRLPRERRLTPRAIPALGLASCLALAFFVEPSVWRSGLALVALGLAWHVVARVRRARRGG